MKISYSVFQNYKATTSIDTKELEPQEIFNKFFTRPKTFDLNVEKELFKKYKRIEKTDDEIYDVIKDTSRCIMFCDYVDPANKYRSGETIKSYHGVALDIDNKINGEQYVDGKTSDAFLTPEELQEQFKDYEYIFYTTLNHETNRVLSARPKFRMMFFYDKPYVLKEHQAIFNVLHNMLRVPAYSDASMKNKSQAAIMPVCEKAQEHLFRSSYNHGKRLCLQSILAGNLQKTKQETLINKVAVKIETPKETAFYLDTQTQATKEPSRVSFKDNSTDVVDVNSIDKKTINTEQQKNKDFSVLAKDIATAINILSQIYCANLSYSNWFEILGACESLGMPWEVFDEWCKTDKGLNSAGLPRYNYADNLSKWQSNNYRAGIAGLISLARSLGIHTVYNRYYDTFVVVNNNEDIEDDYVINDSNKWSLSEKSYNKMPELVHQIADISRRTAPLVSDKATDFAGSLAFLGGLCHKRFSTVDSVRTNLFTLSLAPTSAGKGQIVKVIRKLYDMELVKSFNMNSLRFVKEIPGSLQGMTKDLYLANGNLMYAHTEAEMWFRLMDPKNKQGYANLDKVMMNFYDLSDDVHDGFGTTRHKVKDEELDGLPSKLVKPHFSYFGTSTTSLLDSLITEHATNGLFNRFSLFIGSIGGAADSLNNYNPINKESLDSPLIELDEYLASFLGKVFAENPVGDFVKKLPKIITYEQGYYEFTRKKNIEMLSMLDEMVKKGNANEASLYARAYIKSQKLTLATNFYKDKITKSDFDVWWNINIELVEKAIALHKHENEIKKIREHKTAKQMVLEKLRYLCSTKTNVTLRDVYKNFKIDKKECEVALGQLHGENKIIMRRVLVGKTWVTAYEPK